MVKNDGWVQQIIRAPRLKKYSQTGEEGVLEFILNSIDTGNKFLVDIGAWDGSHLSNTKYFLESRGYTGLLIDGDNRGNEQVKQEWITKDNICEILAKYNCPNDFSLLSFDIDGNDYDVLTAMLSQYKPRVLVCEINGTIPISVSKKIKYNPNHTWNNDDYYGFSFAAAYKLAQNTGYKIVHQNDALNVYMVRNDMLANPNMQINIGFQHCQYHPHNATGEWEVV